MITKNVEFCNTSKSTGEWGNDTQEESGLQKNKFSYETIEQEDTILSALERINKRIQSTLVFAYLNGKDLCQIRNILGGHFVKWLKSQEWEYSDRVAYNYINFFENCDRSGLDEAEIKNIKVGFTKVLSCLSKNKYEVGKRILEAAKRGESVTPQFVAEIEAEANTPIPIKTKSNNYTLEETPRTGCRNCKHYIEANGRETCSRYLEPFRNLVKNYGINIAKGCDMIVEIDATQKEEVNKVALSQECWTKILYEASKQGSDPENFIEETLLTGIEEKTRLELRVKELEEQLKILDMDRNELLTRLKKTENNE